MHDNIIKNIHLRTKRMNSPKSALLSTSETSHTMLFNAMKVIEEVQLTIPMNVL